MIKRAIESNVFSEIDKTLKTLGKLVALEYIYCVFPYVSTMNPYTSVSHLSEDTVIDIVKRPGSY